MPMPQPYPNTTTQPYANAAAQPFPGAAFQTYPGANVLPFPQPVVPPDPSGSVPVIPPGFPGATAAMPGASASVAPQFVDSLPPGFQPFTGNIGISIARDFEPPRPPNPLPAPPRDIWAESPYRKLLSELPETTDFLLKHQPTSNITVENNTVRNEAPRRTATTIFRTRREDKRKTGGGLTGLFRSRSQRPEERNDSGEFIFMDNSAQALASYTGAQPRRTSLPPGSVGTMPASSPSTQPNAATQSTPGRPRSRATSDSSMSEPPVIPQSAPGMPYTVQNMQSTPRSVRASPGMPQYMNPNMNPNARSPVIPQPATDLLVDSTGTPLPPPPANFPPPSPPPGEAPGVQDAVVVSSNTDYASFLNHSPHRVLYQNKTYPTAVHLFEAMKYLPHREDLADRIRTAPTVQEVYQMTGSGNAEWVGEIRRNWGEVMLDVLEEVLYNKFRQHPDVRALLMKTGNRPIAYHGEPGDEYWGSNLVGGGLNVFGKALEKVRGKLRSERFS